MSDATVPEHIRLREPFRLSVLMPVYNERYLVEAAIARVLAFQHLMVRELELVVVDDGSGDGTREKLRELAAKHPQIKLILHRRNQGKGAAIRSAIAAATGELSVIQDADLEYFPEDWAHLLAPFIEAGADVVYGSRFLPASYRRVLYYLHTVGNRLLTTASNMMTDLNLTDMETCYKMVRTSLLKSIPIRSNNFTIEPELTAKLAKRGAVIYEVPIRYAGRTYSEGKKIGARDGLQALGAIVKWRLIDDVYRDDAVGADILTSLSHVRRFNAWMADFIADDVGDRVLEVGAGIGNLTLNLIPRDRFLATEINTHYLDYLRNLAVGRPYLEVQRLDLLDRQGFDALAGQFDTVICLNVLEHVADEVLALRNLHTALEPGGTALILVPQGKWLFGSLDEVVEHEKRYERSELHQALSDAGFRVRSMRDYNRVSVLGWWLNGKLLRRQQFSRVQLKAFNALTPLLRRWDARLPWPGLSLVVVAEKPAP